jgi:predicted NACHT family NTPase
MLYKTDKKEDKIISDFIIDPKEGETFDKQIHNIELFKETLLATNILKKNQDEKLSFHHKTFEEYFGYIYYENNKDSWYKDVYELYNK